jgi:ribonuclease G
MSLELIVDARREETRFALLREGKLIELHTEKSSGEFVVGDIYLGRVKKVAASLNASFIDVGYEKDGFLHYLDVGPQFNSLNKFLKETLNKKQKVADLLYFQPENDIPKDGKIDQIVSHSQPILVQVAKEPISSKGPRLSSEITLAGRYIVLVPFSNKVSVSQKIRESAERDRLREALQSIKPKNFGVIIRTVAQNKKIEELDQDLKNLLEKWKKMFENVKTSSPPTRVLGEIDKASALLRDMLNEDFSKIHINDPEAMESMKAFISEIAPGKEKIIKAYDGKVNIFERFGVIKQIKSCFGKKVPLPSGGYLIVEHTEAMHVIDVNSGNRKGADGQEDNALTTNIEAAVEIARILRLRDMGGIIAIDFIDMYDKENNKMLFDKLKEEMRADRAKHNILPPSRFGVVEITRQRVRPETDIKTNESCPTCKGTGEVQASILMVEEIEGHVLSLINDKGTGKFALWVHPYIEAYLKKGLMSIQIKWLFETKRWIPIRGVSDMPLLSYKFVDKDLNELE